MHIYIFIKQCLLILRGWFVKAKARQGVLAMQVQQKREAETAKEHC